MVAEIKTVVAVFEKNCVDEEICEVPVSGYAPEAVYGVAPQCVKTYKHVCYKEPGLTPVVRKVRNNFFNHQCNAMSVCQSVYSKSKPFISFATFNPFSLFFQEKD